MRPSSSNISIGNIDHVDVEYNIVKSDISFRLNHPFMHETQNYKDLPDILTNVLAIRLGLWKHIIKCFPFNELVTNAHNSNINVGNIYDL